MEKIKEIRISGAKTQSDQTINYENLSEIPKESFDTLTYDEFFTKFMTKNLPVIINLDLSSWDSYNNWILQDRSGLDFAYLRDRFGNISVPIAKCEEKYFDSHKKVKMSFYDYLNYWENRKSNQNQELLYLKDWHLRNELPNYSFYTVPQYFVSDFLNEYLADTGQDDYKFVYIGPANSYTPFHADVFSSYSWSVNIFGRKTWTFVPPGEENKLRDRFGNLPFTIDTKILDENKVRHFIVTQETGNAIFVPSNWHHQVFNEVDTISINHNWFNGANLRLVYEALSGCEKSCRKEISDCQDMENFDQQCQIMLKSLFGMDYQEFLKILDYIVEKRVKLLKIKEKFVVFEESCFHENHIRYDLDQIWSVLMDISEKNLLDKLGLKEFCDKIVEKIDEVS